MTHITTFTDKFPGTTATSLVDDEGQSYVVITAPGADYTLVTWRGDYEHVLAVWEALDAHRPPMTGDPLFDALEALNERLMDEYAMAYADSAAYEIERDNEAARQIADAGLA